MEADALAPQRLDTFAPNSVLDIVKVSSVSTPALSRLHCVSRGVVFVVPCGGRARQFNIVSVAAGVDNSAVITSRGELYTWGFAGADCKLGHGDAATQWEPRLVVVDTPTSVPPKFVSVYLGARHVPVHGCIFYHCRCALCRLWAVVWAAVIVPSPCCRLTWDATMSTPCLQTYLSD